MDWETEHLHCCNHGASNCEILHVTYGRCCQNAILGVYSWRSQESGNVTRGKPTLFSDRPSYNDFGMSVTKDRLTCTDLGFNKCCGEDGAPCLQVCKRSDDPHNNKQHTWGLFPNPEDRFQSLYTIARQGCARTKAALPVIASIWGGPFPVVCCDWKSLTSQLFPSSWATERWKLFPMATWATQFCFPALPLGRFFGCIQFQDAAVNPVASTVTPRHRDGERRESRVFYALFSHHSSCSSGACGNVVPAYCGCMTHPNQKMDKPWWRGELGTGNHLTPKLLAFWPPYCVVWLCQWPSCRC